MLMPYEAGVVLRLKLMAIARFSRAGMLYISQRMPPHGLSFSHLPPSVCSCSHLLLTFPCLTLVLLTCPTGSTVLSTHVLCDLLIPICPFFPVLPFSLFSRHHARQDGSHCSCCHPGGGSLRPGGCCAGCHPGPEQLWPAWPGSHTGWPDAGRPARRRQRLRQGVSGLFLFHSVSFIRC